jgi:hypothetical protein
VARNLVPLSLFGLRTYGATMGRLTLPLNICNALSPLIFALLISRVSASAALTLTASAAFLSLAAVIALRRLAGNSAPPAP